MIMRSFTIFTAAFLLSIINTIRCWSLPNDVCTSPVSLQHTATPTSVVGTGTPSSCNESALATALLRGGIITFDCGTSGQPITIPITNELIISSVNDTILDGGGIVTLNGTRSTRILNFDRANFQYATPILTVQRLRFINGYCQDGYGGCAILQKNGGTTIVINCVFENNIGPTVGQDTAGGAIWTIGGGTTTVIKSAFSRNTCSNGGGLGILGSGLIIYNSLFENNQATGNGGNPGNGGNGGAISFDGLGRNNSICGTRFTANQGNKFGGAFFRVSYNGSEENIFNNVLIDSNYIPASSSGAAGGLYIQGGIVSIRNTTIVNNSASSAGGIFFVNDGWVVLDNVNLLKNQAYSSLGAAVSCSNPVVGIFSGLTVANNYAGAFGAAFASCTGTITLATTIIANNTVGNPWPANACTSPMNDGGTVIQSPINKQSPATGTDNPCVNGSITRVNNISVTLDTTTWQITVTGAQAAYLGPTVIPGALTVDANTTFTTNASALITYSILIYLYILFSVDSFLF